MKEVRAILFKESNGTNDVWVGQCLELDLCAQSEDRNDIIYELEKTIACSAAIGMEMGQTPFEGMNDAPENFFKLWDDLLVEGVERVTLDISDIAEKFTINPEQNWAEAV